LPGGFVNEGEKVKDAVRREAEEKLLVKSIRYFRYLF
jgi:ADP-ribose pyrophosphatase YjhB (NUDIX family)